MYCYKCGSEVPDGSRFCQKCGAKLTNGDIEQQASASTSAEPVQQIWPNAVTADTPEKKKSGKLLIGLGVAVVVMVLVIVITSVAIIALKWNGKVDYVATVGAHTPFADSQGLPYTYEEVVDKYISSPKWEVCESDDMHYVDISGEIKDTDRELTITIEVTLDPDDPDIAKIRPDSVVLDDIKTLTENDAIEFLLAMFGAYDEGYDDLTELMSLIEMLESLESAMLSETYANETEGLSFSYPDLWEEVERSDYGDYYSDESDSDETVVLLSYRNDEGINSTIQVLKFPYDESSDILASDESYIKEHFDDSVSVTDFSDMEIGGVPTRMIAYVTEDDLCYRTYFYAVGTALYRVNLVCKESLAEYFAKIYDAIMESYAITAMPAGQESFNELSKEDKWDVAAVWLHTHGINDYYMCPASELGYGSYDDDDSDLYFELPEDPVFLSGIISFINDDMLVTFPILIDSDSGEWLKTNMYPIEDWYNNIWKTRYDDYDGLSDSSNDNGAMGFTKSLEYYSELSGSYEGSTGQSILSISIYTSWEEASIGNVEIYVDDEWYYLGNIIAEPEQDVYLVETDAGEEVLLDVYSAYGTIAIDLYVDGEYIDEYLMVEHYES